MKLTHLIICISVCIAMQACQNQTEVNKYSEKSAYDLVNPFIGTGGHGHTYPGATLPFGMVQLSPDTRLDGWDGCSGYHYSDSVIYGFSHTHLSGTGVSDYGDVLIMPFNHSDVPEYDELLKHSIVPSQFDKVTEKAAPGHYQVHLNEPDIEVTLTATERVGIHQYHFNKPANNKLLIDLNHRDKVLDHGFSIIDSNTISGHRISNAWATNQHLYFYIEFSETFKIDLPIDQGNKADFFRILSFKSDLKDLVVKVGISAVSTAGAQANLEAEAKNWDYSNYLADAKTKWETALHKIEVKGANEDKLTIFYSALYHTQIVPNIFSDVTGQYRGMDQKIHQSDQHNIYTVFSLWDTFRGAHPLYTIIEQEKTNAFIRTFLKHYQQGGRLPVWELAGNETDCMIGYHSIPVILDAYMKGIKDYDINLALEAMTSGANLNRGGLSAYRNKGFIAAGDESESVSKTLEYAYDDWCIAQMAKQLNQDSIYTDFIKRSQYFKNIFNGQVGFMQAKMNGSWTSGFNPTEVNFNFTEANAWQYSLFAPHDIDGLVELLGGLEKFEAKLDELFSTELEMSGRHQADITGLIGQYAHGNEPSHHMAYLYSYIGKAYKTQDKVNQILSEQYHNAPDGLSGNEDCGQMSAWYVLSSMGFYSVTPGLDYYSIGTPHFSEANINLENGLNFSITAHNLSETNIYIQSAKLNQNNFNQSYIKHKDIVNGGELVFEMGSTPNKSWGSNEAGRPISNIPVKDQIVSVPYTLANGQTFSDSIAVELACNSEAVDIYFSTDGENYQKYDTPILIKNSTDISAYSQLNGKKSHVIQSNYKKIKGGRSIQLLSEYSNQYSAGGDNALIDYLKGTANFRTGYWQGYQGQNINAIVDLGQSESVNIISVGTLQDIKSWVWFPNQVRILASQSNDNFKEIVVLKNKFPNDKNGAFLQEFSHALKQPLTARFIKIELEYAGDCPTWHLGSGGKSWLFIDEITVE